MSRFRKLSQTIWHCQYHIVWVPKYRFQVLTGGIANEVEHCVRAFAEQQGGEIVELSVQVDHVHMLIFVPPKVSISKLLGTVKGRTAIRVFQKFPYLKEKPYWGNHFWSPGYCVDTIGLDAEMIQAYVKYQEKKERRAEQLKLHM